MLIESSTPRASAIWRSATFRRSISPLVFLVIFVVLRAWSGPGFARAESRALDIHQSVPVLVLGLAAMVTLVAGFFDLSVASMATLTTFLTIGLRANDGWPMPLVIGTCLVIGVVGGFINGLLVVRARVNTFIATLGTGGVFAGLSAAYSGGTQMTPGIDDPQLPRWFSSLGSFGHKVPPGLGWAAISIAAAGVVVLSWRMLGAARYRRARPAILAGALLVTVGVAFLADLERWVRAMTWLVALLVAVAAVLWLLMNRTTFGRHLYATGANSNAARLAGVPVARESIKAFVLGGFLAALAGVLLAASQGSAAQGAANGSLLPAFAAAFLSTVIFSLGHFTVWGTVFGGAFLIWVSQGLIFGGVKFTWTAVVNGLVLLIAVSFSTMSRRSRA